MMRLTTMLAAASAVAALGAAAAANAQSVEMGAVPDTVVAVAKAAAPGVEWSKAGVDVDADTLTPVYELTGTKGGKQVEVDVTPTGEVDEIETQVEMSAVPEAAQKLLKVYLPQFEATMVERSTRRHGQVFYEFSGRHDGREIDVEVSEAGDVIMINDDAAA
jgi:opacity protein-like surface antigen